VAAVTLGDCPMIKPTGANLTQVTCKECGAVTQIASVQIIGRPDDRCKQGHAKNVLWCPSMHAAVSETIADRVGRDG
jgi:hypothetical protein